MTIVAVDDTDSRTDGMCTTYVATLLAERLADADARVRRRLLVRLNPAVKHKTRGNAAVALHVDGGDAATTFEHARDLVSELAVHNDPRTSPGVVVADVDVAGDPFDPETSPIPDAVGAFARRALRERLALDEALALADDHGFRHAGIEADADAGAEAASDEDAEATPSVEGRGRIGALAAVGAPLAFEDWTHEHVSYRKFDRCGTPREVDADSAFTAAERGYPTVWDTVDRGTGEVVCVPNAPGPILHGIRGDDPEACRTVAAAIASEPVDRAATFLTNQGTDAHVAPGRIGELRDGAGYRVAGTVTDDPETKQGGHVHVDVAGSSDEGPTLRCVAFAPTGRFRDRVRALRPGDRVTVCGEHEVREATEATEATAETDSGNSTSTERSTLKLEKLAVRDLVRTELVTPTCPDCSRRMSSAGRGQGYRCRDCDTSVPGRVERPIGRALEPGWYEVPPSARRHVAKPLVRGGFDAETHPER